MTYSMVVLFKNTFLLWFSLSLFSISQGQAQIQVGAEQIEAYLPLLKNKNIGVVAHASSLVRTQNQSIHLIDTLLALNIQIDEVFAPEHGFRSKADNGEHVDNTIDPKTQLPLISLHGKNKKPQVKDLEDIDLMVFDIQDVGVRFYTYLSTLHLVMEACAENNIPLLILDRPNPNAHYVDGPVLEDEFKSFLGKHNVPIVYGLTLGEYAQMINKEGWLANEIACKLSIIPIKNYTHKTPYALAVRPSPNLPNDQAINLYPSLCLLEQTPVSIGRGTEMQFQVFGHPDFKNTGFQFKPQPNFGAKYPKQENKDCYGLDLRKHPGLNKIELKWLMNAYQMASDKEGFFFERFAFISGTKTLQHQIQEGLSEQEIRTSWKPKIDAFLKIRANYLLYED